ncbi:hypothetical protein [Kribbella sp. NPDC055071]
MVKSLEPFLILAEAVAESRLTAGEFMRLLSPAEYELEDNPGDAEKYVLLTPSYGRLRNDFGKVLDLAKAHGLVGYSGVGGEPIAFGE